MSRGTNQKFKLYHLKNIMVSKTDDTHSLTMPQILEELEKHDVTAERKVYIPTCRTLKNSEWRLQVSRWENILIIRYAAESLNWRN